MKDFRNFDDKYVIEILNLNDPHEAAAYLETALEEYEKDNNIIAFLTVLRRIIEVKGGVTELSKKTGLNRQNLYKILTNKTNPRFNTLSLILHSLGFRFSLKAS